MAETTNKYLELSVFNNSKKGTVKSTVKYKGSDLTQDKNYSQLTIWKWNIICNNFPTWLPSIRDPKFNVVYKPYVPPDVDMSQIFYRNPELPNFATYYLTDWSITVKYTSSPFPTGQTYSNSYVQFLKPISKGPNVVDFDEDGDLPERFMLDDKTKFFWGNSTQLGNMIEESLNAFGQYNKMSRDDYRFVKNGEYWSILTKVDALVEKIYLNDEMRRYFDFSYDYDNGIAISKGLITVMNNIEYYVTSTEKTNSYLFPFRNITMTFDNGLNVFPQYIGDNSTQSNYNPTDNILTKFTLNVTDINQIGNCIEYSTECKDRSLSLTNDSMRPFSIQIYLESAQKNIFTLELQRLDEINILFMIS